MLNVLMVKPTQERYVGRVERSPALPDPLEMVSFDSPAAALALTLELAAPAVSDHY
jgi:hypothetical protein